MSDMPPRIAFPEPTTLPVLRAMAAVAARGKRSSPDVASFLCDADQDLLGLRDELSSRADAPDQGPTLRIAHPKPRVISALPVRDRIVQHLVIAATLPRIYLEQAKPAGVVALRRSARTSPAASETLDG